MLYDNPLWKKNNSQKSLKAQNYKDIYLHHECMYIFDHRNNCQHTQVNW